MRFGDKMKLRLVSAVSLVKRMGGSLRFIEVVSGLPWFTPPRADARKLLELYNTNPWVRSIVGKVGRAVANQKWYFETAAGERVDKHPALDFLRAGNPKMRGRKAIELTQVYLDLCGEAFWAIGREGKSGPPVGYAPIPPHWVVDVPHENQAFYVLEPRSGIRIEIPPEQMLWFKEFDPTDPYGRGRGITGAAYTELQTHEAATEFLYAHFKNHCRPSLIVSGTKEAPLTNSDRIRGEASWAEKFGGPAKSGRTFWSTHPLQAQEFGFGLRDNVVDKIADGLKATISEIYNMPPELLGRLESSNRATIDAADFLFGKHTVDPRLGGMQDTIEPFLAVNFDTGELLLCYETPIKEEIAVSLSVMQAFPAKFTGNEVRTLIGRKPKPELDELNDDPLQLAADAAAEFGADDPNADPAADNKPPEPKALPAPAPRVKSLTPEDIVRVSMAHEDPSVHVEASAIMDRIFMHLLAKYGADLLEALESDVRFQLNMRVAEWLISKGSKLIARVNRTTRDQLQAALVSGVADGADLAQLSATIDDLFAEAAAVRAATIGITQATELTGFGSQAAAEQGGFEEKQWLTSQDQVVRDTHAEMEGQIRRLEEQFISPSGAMADYPGAFGVAAEDINCRCAMRPVLPGEKLARPQFARWHDAAYKHVVAEVAKSMAKIFEAQAEVTKTVLRRLLPANPV